MLTALLCAQAAPPPTSPPEVEATLTRLASYKSE